MQNILSNLDVISKKLNVLLGKYQDLKAENEQLKDIISNLKVDAENYKSNLKLNINKEEERKEEGEESLNKNTDNSKIDNTEVEINKVDEPKQLKIQLDEIIDDIDKCIHIIQSSEDGR